MLNRIVKVALLVFFTWIAAAGAAFADDSVYLKATGSRAKKTGKITSVSPETVVIQSGAKTNEIPSGNIRKIVYDGEPNSLDRARERFENGRFDDCLTELQKIKSASGGSEQEIAYLQAFANAEICLRGGEVTALDAGKGIQSFLGKYPNSYRFYPATELMGKLSLAIGRADLAEGQFTKLSEASWPEYRAKGLFYLGNTQLLNNKIVEAKSNLEAIDTVDSNDPVILDYKLFAECLLAKTEALEGQVEAGRKRLEAIIKREDPMVSQQLFAQAYNALGACFEKAENWEEAALAYLHTELLFAQQPELHAESLFRLSRIWTKLEESDRANKARKTLRDRYPNSYWAAKSR